MKNLYALVLFSSIAFGKAGAQYCDPTFASGCFSWTNLSVDIGTISWSMEDCTVADYTALSTSVTAGTPVAMSVTSGTWTGCAVWVDLDNNGAFEDSENLYTSYVGGDPSHTYAFNITIPVGTLSGPHRMRIIAPWGSDGTTEGPNGFGPCGAYQYGNFNDFTITLPGSVGVEEQANNGSVTVVPNPTTGPVRLVMPDGAAWDRVAVRGLDGRLVREVLPMVRSGAVELDLSDLPQGVYCVQARSAGAWRTVQVLKQ